MTTNQLLDSLYRIDPNTTGILFASWFYKTTFAGNTSLITNAHKLIVTTTAPIFTLNMTDITEENGGMIGGYTYNQKHYSQQLIHTISEILAGKQAREIPFLYAIGWRAYYQLYDITPQRVSLLPCVRQTHIF